MTDIFAWNGIATSVSESTKSVSLHDLLHVSVFLFVFIFFRSVDGGCLIA